MVAMGMLGIITMTVDTSRVADNAGGIAEMSGLRV